MSLKGVPQDIQDAVRAAARQEGAPIGAWVARELRARLWPNTQAAALPDAAVLIELITKLANVAGTLAEPSVDALGGALKEVGKLTEEVARALVVKIEDDLGLTGSRR
jgi:hypothetical protein